VGLAFSGTTHVVLLDPDDDATVPDADVDENGQNG
jgi:hypothetical protein